MMNSHLKNEEFCIKEMVIFAGATTPKMPAPIIVAQMPEPAAVLSVSLRDLDLDLDLFARGPLDTSSSSAGKVNCASNDELCTKNDELCTRNYEICIKNDDFCI